MKKTAEASYDYIVVGGGSAGAILATRLSEDPGSSVLLLEAGREDDSYWTRLPLGFGKILFDDRYVKRFDSRPEAQLNGRQISLPYGNLLGGSGAINGLVWLRGAPYDYDNWARNGATGWSYEDVLPYFKKMERRHGGPSEYHGGDGSFGVEKARWTSDIAEALLAAAERLQVPRNQDMNGRTNEGCFYNELATWNGYRSTTSQNYLKPARSRPNLTVHTGSPVDRVLFTDRKATGVLVRHADGERVFQANREVILCAGALHTPQILQLSGVGPAELLRKHGIAVIHDQPNVGENLMDHLNVVCPFHTNSRDTFNARVRTIAGMIREGINFYLGNRHTPLAVGAGLAAMYVRSRPDVPAADMQIGFAPFMPGEKGYDLAEQSGFFIGGFPARPESRGHVRIVAGDPRAQPEVWYNHMSTPGDVESMLAVMRFIQRLAATPELQRVITKSLAPLGENASEDEMLGYIRQVSSTSFHYSGTARMGSDEGAVVDPQLRVRGVSGLRVVDASIMPLVVASNTNPATMMIAERAADLIRGKTPTSSRTSREHAHA